MRPSSLGGGRILRRTLSVRLSVRLSVCPSVPLSSFRWRHLANYNDTHVLFGRGPHIVRPSRPHKFLFHQLLDDGIPASIVKFIAYWYSNQLAVVRWHNNVSAPFTIGNSTKQGGVLSPYLSTRYIRQLLYAISSCGVSCMICGASVNILAYADDIVLLAPSWKALQIMLDLLCKCCKLLDITCNPAKTVCVNFPPTDRMKVVAHIFPEAALRT